MASLFPLVGRKEIAKAIKTKLGSTYEVQLFQNQVTVNSSTVKDDMTVADFDGYAPKTPDAVSDPYVDPVNGGFSLNIGGGVWVPSGDVDPPQTIYGWFVTAGVGADLIACGNFDDPIVITGVDTAVPLDITLNL